MTQDKIAFVTCFCIWALILLFILVLPVPKIDESIKEFGETVIHLEPFSQVDSSNVVSENTSVEELLPETQTMPQVIESVEESATIQAVTQEATPETNHVQAIAQNQESIATSVVQANPEPRRAQALTKSIEELIAEQTARTSTSQAQWSDDVFGESSTVMSTTQQTNIAATSQSTSTLSGSAAQSSSREIIESSVVSQGETARSPNTNSTASEETLRALSSISSTPSTSTFPGNNFSETANTTPEHSSNNISGGYDIAFTDGQSRRLLYPENPTLIISSENKKLIQSSRNVRVSFDVLKDGTVGLSSIVFTPSALIPLEIQSELRSQIAQWRFEKGESTGQATFIYSIVIE